MTDLISREALIKETQNCFVDGKIPHWLYDLIINEPAIEQGEAVIDKAAYDGAREDLSIWKRRALEAEEKVRKYDQRIVDIGVIAMTPVTTPQQPQEQDELVKKAVADALEDAAKICDELAEQDYCVDVRVASEAIRALIKRNAKEGEVKHDTNK